jgi:transposase
MQQFCMYGSGGAGPTGVPTATKHSKQVTEMSFGTSIAVMRGLDHQQSKIFSYLSPESRVRKGHPLRTMRAMVDEVLDEMAPVFEAMYSTTGRPSVPPEKLLRVQLIQMLYSIRSERLLMEEIDYSVLFRWFVGMNMDEEVWDATTFTKNRDRLSILNNLETNRSSAEEDSGLLKYYCRAG